MEKTLTNKFGVQEVKHHATLEGVQYFTAIDSTFDDEVEIQVMANGDVYTRISVEGVDIDVEIEGVSDFYVHRGTTKIDEVTAFLERIENFLAS